MSFFSDFEDRIADLFDTAPQGYVEPFSFKKLAKRAAKEMENETYEIDGIDTAPALYTVLVSSADDALMHPLYASITDEISSFVAAQANKKGYVFVGKPLVRFMVDPSLKSGKFAVFAENVDAPTLKRLRKEEQEFLAGSAGVGGAAAQSGVTPIPQSDSAPELIPLETIFDDGGSPFDDGSSDGLKPLTPLDFPAAPAAAPVVSAAPAAAPVVSAAPAAAHAVPQTQRRSNPVDAPAAPAHVGRHAAHAAAAEPIVIEPAATALLIDRQTGRTFRVEEPSGIIGRERSQADVVLTDPNISRRHAELRFDGRYWHITDLRSTNGTLVNDVDIDECILRNGDLITIGLTNLEFRES